MSLSNPNKVVTEERLNEYHNAILPYLGGMPDILANKFSRADLYSTDEKMIGRWIDGKPIYQKTFTFPSQVTLNSNSWYVTNFDGSDIEHTISAFVYFDAGGMVFPVYSDIDNNKIELLQTRSAAMTGTGGFVLQYTKTTDSPVEIGLDTDYSTTEKIVGTWVDGKPIYQKVLRKSDGTPLPQDNDVSDLHIDLLIRAEGLISNNSDRTYPRGLITSTSGLDRREIYMHDANTIRRNGSSFYCFEIILQYTKTTD